MFTVHYLNQFGEYVPIGSAADRTSYVFWSFSDARSFARQESEFNICVVRNHSSHGTITYGLYESGVRTRDPEKLAALKAYRQRCAL